MVAVAICREAVSLRIHRCCDWPFEKTIIRFGRQYNHVPRVICSWYTDGCSTKFVEESERTLVGYIVFRCEQHGAGKGVLGLNSSSKLYTGCIQASYRVHPSFMQGTDGHTDCNTHTHLYISRYCSHTQACVPIACAE